MPKGGSAKANGMTPCGGSHHLDRITGSSQDDLPTYPFSSKQCKYGVSPLLPTTRCSQELDTFEFAYNSYYPILERAREQVPGARLINTADYFCSNEADTCNMTHDGTLLYADGSHLNIQGSRYLIGRLLEEDNDLRTALTRKD